MRSVVSMMQAYLLVVKGLYVVVYEVSIYSKIVSSLLYYKEKKYNK